MERNSQLCPHSRSFLEQLIVKVGTIARPGDNVFDFFISFNYYFFRSFEKRQNKVIFMNKIRSFITQFFSFFDIAAANIWKSP